MGTGFAKRKKEAKALQNQYKEMQNKMQETEALLALTHLLKANEVRKKTTHFILHSRISGFISLCRESLRDPQPAILLGLPATAILLCPLSQEILIEHEV